MLNWNDYGNNQNDQGVNIENVKKMKRTRQYIKQDCVLYYKLVAY